MVIWIAGISFRFAMTATIHISNVSTWTTGRSLKSLLRNSKWIIIIIIIMLSQFKIHIFYDEWIHLKGGQLFQRFVNTVLPQKEIICLWRSNSFLFRAEPVSEGLDLQISYKIVPHLSKWRKLLCSIMEYSKALQYHRFSFLQ